MRKKNCASSWLFTRITKTTVLGFPFSATNTTQVNPDSRIFTLMFVRSDNHWPMSHLSFHTKSFNWDRILMKFRFLSTYRQRGGGGLKQFIPSVHMVTVLQLHYLYPFSKSCFMSGTPGLEKTVAMNTNFENDLNYVRNMTASCIVRKLKLGYVLLFSHGL